MVSQFLRDSIRLICALSLTAIVATVCAMFAGVFLDPEGAIEAERQGREIAAKIAAESHEKGSVSEERMNELASSSELGERDIYSYSTVDALYAGFRQSGHYFFLLYFLFLVLARPGVVMTLVLSGAVAGGIALAIRWPHPAPYLMGATVLYVLLRSLFVNKQDRLR